MQGSYVLDSKKFNENALDWVSLKTALTESGLRVIDPKEGKYAIVRYDRKTGDVKPGQEWFRSVVYDKETAKVVCVSPPKSSSLQSAAWPLQTPLIQDFTDGVMINLFWVADSEVQIVTRSRLGADNKFYSELSFLEMLKQAVGSDSFDSLKPYANSSTQFVSLVLQHPLNRVVTEVTSARVSVVHVGFVDADGSVHVEENPDSWIDGLKALAPTSMTVNADCLVSLDALTEYVNKQGATLGYMWQGYCLKDGNGARYRIRNKEYSKVRSLRGNESDSLARFSRLRSTRSIKAYLKFYPEDEDTFYKLEGGLRSATRKLLENYANTFKFKKQEFHTLAWPYKYHVSILHNKFKEVLKPNRKTVDLAFVIEYINGLGPEDMGNLFKEPKPKRVVPSVTDAPSVSA